MVRMLFSCQHLVIRLLLVLALIVRSCWPLPLCLLWLWRACLLLLLQVRQHDLPIPVIIRLATWQTLWCFCHAVIEAGSAARSAIMRAGP